MKQKNNKKIYGRVRHPTRKKVVNPTHSDPTISIASGERRLLRYLYKINNERFNVRDYSIHVAKIPRSTVYDYLNKLERYGFVKKELANNKITEKGMILLQSSENEGVGGSRTVCREKEKLSTHFHKFKLPISDKRNFNNSRIKELNAEDVKENKLHNLHQTIIYFSDATIVINPKQLIINLYDIISDNVEDSDLESLNRAIEYAKKLMKIGIVTEGILVEEGHWARVDSILSEMLYERIDNKYLLDLGDGKKFWIDHSLGKKEDETNDKVVRERVDKFLTEISNNDVSLLDIDKITKSLGFISKLESTRLLNEIDLRNKNQEVIKKQETGAGLIKTDYLGYIG